MSQIGRATAQRLGALTTAFANPDYGEVEDESSDASAFVLLVEAVGHLTRIAESEFARGDYPG